MKDQHLVLALSSLTREVILLREVIKHSRFQERVCFLTKKDLEEIEERLNMKLSDLKNDLTGLKAQVEKIFTEQGTRFDTLTAKINELEKQIADAEVPQDVTDALAEVKTALQKLDDTIPDITPPTANLR